MSNDGSAYTWCDYCQEDFGPNDTQYLIPTGMELNVPVVSFWCGKCRDGIAPEPDHVAMTVFLDLFAKDMGL